MNTRPKLLLLALALILAALACILTGNGTPAEDESGGEVATVVAATMQSQEADQPPAIPPTSNPNEELPPAPIQEDTVLPHSLYYLSELGGGSFQVWRLERDSITQSQITAEPIAVDDFDVSPVDGRVAYIVNNQLYLINADGSGRQLLLDGGPIDENSDDYHYRTRISGLSWSPDGRTLAYGQNGVNLYSFNDGSVRRVVENDLEVLDGGYLMPRALYFPHSWAPDGSKLLVNIGFFEGASLAVVHPANNQVVQFGSGLVCCDPYWAPDASSVVVGSPVLGLIDPGLWRYDAATGFESVLLPTTAEDGTLNFAGWPMQTANGDLLYFFQNVAAIPEGESPLTLVRAGNDGISGRVQLRPEAWEIYEALWAEDGAFVLTVQPSLGQPSWPRRGPVVLIDALGSPVRPLAASARRLKWGP